jgi:hypothetical protein
LPSNPYGYNNNNNRGRYNTEKRKQKKDMYACGHNAFDFAIPNTSELFNKSFSMPNEFGIGASLPDMHKLSPTETTTSNRIGHGNIYWTHHGC